MAHSSINRTGRTLSLFIIIVFSILSMIPFFAMLIMSTHTTQEIMTNLSIFPGRNAIENISSILVNGYGTYFFNSLYVAILTSIGGALITNMAGYSFAKFKFPFKNPLFMIILGSMMLPPQLSLVGITIEMRYLGWLNTHLPLIIPPMAYAGGVFFVRSFAQEGIPFSMIESGRIDGASELKIFFQITFPLMKPAFMTIVILLYIWSWNNYLYPLIMINESRLYTIPLALSTLGNMFRADYGARMMAVVLGTIPTLLLMVLGRKHLVEGLAGTSVKG